MLITVIAYVIKNQVFDDEINEYLIDNEIEKTEKVYNKDTIVVHVTGEVRYSGVVTLEEVARVVDAIASAGGETEEADLEKLNLAYILSDGEKIYVPNKNEEQKELITSEAGENISGGSEKDSKNKLININIASVEALATLPGIGQSLAERIVSYREEQGKFAEIEEIKNVSGIGDSKFENIKLLICI